MSSISPSPSFAPVEAHNMWSTALDMPFSPLKTFAWGIDQGGAESFGLGTAIRGAITPSGNEPPPMATGNPLIDVINAPAAIRAGIEGIGRLITGQPNPPMDKAAYEQSPYFRTAIPWDPGMTEDRAAALASTYDIQTAKDYFGSKDRLPYLIGNFVGQAADPINYVPLFGEAAQTAAVARFGVNAATRLGIRAGVGALDAASNTALFGALTAEQRAKYGDDISWQAQINNIAMAAVIGGVLSPVVHAVTTAGKTLADLRAEASVQSKVETVPNVGVARAITNDAVTGLATEGEVKLSPASGAALERLSTDMAAKHETARATETAFAETKAADAQGQPLTLYHGTTAAFDTFDAGKLGARSGNPAAEFGVHLTPDRSIAELFTRDKTTGLPVEGGRIIAANVAIKNPKVMSAREYLQWGARARASSTLIPMLKRDMIAQGYDGIKIEPLTAKDKAEIPDYDGVSDYNAEQWIAFSPDQVRNAVSSTPAEIAALHRAAIDEPAMRILADGPVTAPDNRAFVQRFLTNLPPSERATVADAAGNLTKDGVRRVENAVVASAFGDDAGIIGRFAEATDDATRSVVGALSDVAGKWALMRRAIKSGELSPEFDVTPELTSGLRKLSAWREAASRENRPVSTVIKEGMGQLDMLDGEMSLEAKTMIRAFYKTDEFKQGAGRDAIAARLSHIVDAANDLGRPQLFGDAEALTKLGVLEHAIDRSEADLFASADAGTGTDGLRQSRGQRQAGADRGNGQESSRINQGGGRPPILDQSSPEFQALTPAMQQIERDYALATKMGLVDDIEAAAARRLTAKQTANELGSRLSSIDDAAKANGEAWAAQGQKETLVRAVRSKLDIPSMDETAVFDAWAARHADQSGGPERSGADAAGVERPVDSGAAGAPSPKTVEVFHGTLEKFDAFDPSKLGSETGSEDAKIGFYFTDNAKVAEGYAAPVNPYADHKILTGKLGRVYVALNEALIKLVRGKGLIGKPGEIIRARLTFDNPLVHDAGGKEMSGAARAEVLRQAKADGHDGVVFENSRDPGYTDASDIPANVYVAFDAKKVEIVSWHKSAADAEAARAKPSSEVAPRAETQTVLPFPERAPATDMSPPRPDVPPDGLREAAARVGTAEDYRALAAQHGVSEDGSFAEQMDIDQMREAGQLTDMDEKMLTAADDNAKEADLYGKSLLAAANCVSRAL